MPVISALERQRYEHYRFEANLCYTSETLSQREGKRDREREKEREREIYS
jgi:hypothetical protein